ncbi:50S ribosome-binding GTPase [Candidatus Woesearchaeota archaeon]|nr:50S ribosome-binding GTPase [Candidatus Woesearchaeota archaeon]
MANFWKIVNEVIKEADVVLEVVDARLPLESRNPEIEDKIIKSEKKLVVVLNKCDLVDKRQMDRIKREIKNSVFVSATKMLGTTILKKRIIELGRGESITVGVVGYPNTGKSSVINALAGRSKASTSSQSGHTRGRQLIRAGGKIVLIDTPGVIPFKEKDEFKHALIATTDFSKVSDPEDIAVRLIAAMEGVIERHYNVKEHKDPEEALEDIAKKKNMLKKGCVPDTLAAAREIIKDWQNGRILY